MVEGDRQASSSEEWTEFSTFDISGNYSTAVDDNNSSPCDVFFELITIRLNHSLPLYLKKYNKAGFVETSSPKVAGIEGSSSLSGLWNASSQMYLIPRQYLWGNSCTKAILSVLTHDDCDAAGDNFCSTTQNEMFDILDMHKLCKNAKTGNNSEIEMIQTADEVIEEIEGILQLADSQVDPGDDKAYEEHSINLTFNTGLEDFEEIVANTPIHTYEDALLLDKTDNERSKALKHMTTTELLGELKDLEASIKLLSESLLFELNVRDDLIFEKEIRNSFITKMLEVQYKQEQLKQGTDYYKGSGRSKFGKLTRSFSMGNTSQLDAGRFLTTVIPYDNGSAPSLENLQVLIPLLDAIKQDSSDVPALITDYILNVLCPAPVSNRILKF